MPSQESRRLFELAGAEDDRRTSPFCWRIRLSLVHKGLAFESVPWRRVEKKAIAFSGQKLVPVLVDGSTVVTDSWKIAKYLDTSYPDKPSLFGDAKEKAGIIFAYHWLENLDPSFEAFLHPGALAASHAMDKDYFTNKIESMVGKKFEQHIQDPTPENMGRFRQSLQPMRSMLAEQSYFGGSEPNFADIAVVAVFLWVRAISPIKMLKDDDPIFAWRERMFDTYHECIFETKGYDYK